MSLLNRFLFSSRLLIVQASSASIIRLLSDRTLCRRLAENAARDARNRFDIERYADDFIDWYEEILDGEAATRTRSAAVAAAASLQSAAGDA